MPLNLIRTVLLSGLCLVASPTWAQQGQNFVSVIEDLPLMQGLSEVGEGVQFSTSQGRIVEVNTQGSVSENAVLGFYNRTLPQLGWHSIGKGRFVREDETLELVFETSTKNLKVRFALAPVFRKK